MPAWFLQYNIFYTKQQYQKAGELLKREMDAPSPKPLVFLLGFSFFSKIYVDIPFLKESLLKALFLFPSSLWVKECFLWVLVNYYAQEEESAYWISEKIFPILSPPQKENAKLYKLLGQYFSEQKILDSALFYTDMAFFYENRPSFSKMIFFQKLFIQQKTRAYKEMVTYLLENPLWWSRDKSLEFLGNFLTSQNIFWPSPTLKSTLRRAIIFTNAKTPPQQLYFDNKERPKKKRWILWILYLLIIMLFFTFFLEHR